MSMKTAPTPDPAKPAPPPASDATPLEVFFKGNRPLMAAAMFALLEAVPVAGLVVALRENADVWLVFAGALMAGALLPPVGVFLGQKWGFVLGQYVVWGSLVGVILRVLHTGFNMIYLAPAIVLGVILVALSAPRSSSGESSRKQPEKKPESFGVWVKENIEAIVIAFIMALVIRCFCIEVFKIPSSSMEPTLLGDISDNHSRAGCIFADYHVPPAPPPPRIDTASGDRIMVTKYYYAFSAVERFDVLVFKFPLNQAKNFIKRVVGLPDEWLQIHRGNLYVSKEEKGPYQIARRTPRTQDSIWINPAIGSSGYLSSRDDFNRTWDSEKPPGRREAAHFEVKDGELSTVEKDGERSSLFSYQHKYLDNGAAEPVDDVRIVFDFELTSPKGQVFAEVVNSYGRFEARLDTDGASELRYHKPGSEKKEQPTTQIPLKDVHLSTDRRYKLELAIFDGMAYVRVNDGERAKHPFITTKEEITTTESPDRRIAFGSRGATFKVRNIAVGRDIYYKGRNLERDLGLAEDTPLHIGSGQYLMMGDNVANSHDSRAWVQRTFKLRDGRTIVCESQQVNEGMSGFNRRLQEKLQLEKPLKYGIDGDEHGNEVAITEDNFLSEEKKAFRFVDEKFIVGKALWIWWPQGRWFHLIR
jgi:signal peptidase I